MLVAVIVEVMNKLQREGTILNEAPVYVKEVVEPRMNRQEEEQYMFLEDDLVQTMRRKNREVEDVVRTPLTVEGSTQSTAEEGPIRKSVKEVSRIGPRLELRPIVENENCSNEVGFVSVASSSLEAPPGFEVPYGRRGKSNTEQEQRTSSNFDEGVIEVEESEEIEKNGGESDEEVPQTPQFDSMPSRQWYINEVERPRDEDPMEAPTTWEVGKLLGCSANNEKAVIEALAKIPECQDFIMPRKRGRPKKNKGKTKV